MLGMLGSINAYVRGLMSVDALSTSRKPDRTMMRLHF